MIIRNALKCNKCGDVIQSTHVHDYVECMCGETMVDGGNSYFRYGGNDVETLFVETHTPYVPHSVQLENSEFTIAAHHPDTCAGEVCSLHKRTEHEMRGWKQGVEIVGATFVITRTCSHGFIHTDPDDFYVRDFEWCNSCKPKHKGVVF